jgi:hypothetical protein
VKERLQCASRDLRILEDAWLAAGTHLIGPAYDARALETLQLYRHAIRLLPLMANVGLDVPARFRTLAGSDTIARMAASRALAIGNVYEAVEMLEEGRGVFWAQALRLRAEGLDGVPEADRVELQRLLRALGEGAAGGAGAGGVPEQYERELEERRMLNTQVEALITRIRTHPGLQRFLMPATFETLVQSLPVIGFFIIINSSRLGCHALLLSRSAGITASLELTPAGSGFDPAMFRTSLPRDAGYTAQAADAKSVDRAMGVSGKPRRADVFEKLLQSLWSDVVEPIIKKLGLKVSSPFERELGCALTDCFDRKRVVVRGRAPGGV